LDKIRVVGKHLPVTIYEPQVGAGGLGEGELVRFHAALQLYRDREWVKAKAIFEALAAALPNDQPVRLYVERCDFFIQHPPVADWDGVFNRAEK